MYQCLNGSGKREKFKSKLEIKFFFHKQSIIERCVGWGGGGGGGWSKFIEIRIKEIRDLKQQEYKI